MVISVESLIQDHVCEFTFLFMTHIWFTQQKNHFAMFQFIVTSAEATKSEGKYTSDVAKLQLIEP